MRHLLLYLILSASFFSAFSQNTGIAVGTTNPHPSAAFEIKDSIRGFLPPRITYVQRNSISNPAQGLIIYCTDCDSSGQAQIYNGTKWTNLTGGAALNPISGDLPSVTIGTQIWHSRNLDVATYSNGDPIPQVTDPTQWFNLSTGAWCWYNYDSATYAATYGRLYNWYAVVDSRGLCPSGWHVPSDPEWSLMASYLGGQLVAGGKMKSTTGWSYPNSGATNSSGFSAIPAGFRDYTGAFEGNGSYAYFWSTSEASLIYGWLRSLSYLDDNLSMDYIYKQSGFSVRCVKD